MYENFVGTWETVRNREVSVLERCPHGEVRLYTNPEQTPLKRCQQLPAPYKRFIHDEDETDKRTSNRPT